MKFRIVNGSNPIASKLLPTLALSMSICLGLTAIATFFLSGSLSGNVLSALAQTSNPLPSAAPKLQKLQTSANKNSIPRKLSDAEIEKVLPQLSGWSIVQGKLHKTFKFKNFIQAFGFLTKVAIAAEKLEHHPEIYNVYNVVTLDLTTHDAGGISMLDVELANQINAL
jgi:4a-hydroxytetrahydrobiopterin dehydratase